ncbi:putative toxin-antitoxin system toxin component, PIN family [Ottowia sp.]|uniref:putative toxin-antitoxin system toxin component, PIN family n=1 Tax=Ottowia sp. TaxID=1898956 RepID=UPI0039E4719E
MSPRARREALVLDTNLVVSAFLRPDGAAAQALLRALQDFDVVASHETLHELLDVLGRDKFERYLPRPQPLQYAQAYSEAVRRIDVSTRVTDCTDPKDNKFLALAIDAGACALVSGDKKDLLGMNPYRGIRILSVREFLDG